MHSTAL